MRDVLSQEMRESLVRTACSTAKVRAKREKYKVDVWYSMGEDTININADTQECAWVRSEAEGPPTRGAEDDEIDKTAFLLCSFDQWGEIDVIPARFAWVKDISGLSIEPEIMCGNCIDYCTAGRVVEYLRRLRDIEEDYYGTVCKRCGRPLHMPGL